MTPSERVVLATLMVAKCVATVHGPASDCSSHLSRATIRVPHAQNSTHFIVITDYFLINTLDI